MRSGEVRVLLGSTQKMGAGTNCQDRMIAIHDLDAPWRPGDLEQRKGRLVRQGNRNPKVRVYRYVTEGTFDAYLWQTLENKQRFISQVMTSKSPVRSAEDADEAALSYAEVKALCAGDPRVKEKMDLDVEVAKLRVLKSAYLSQRYRLQNDLLHTFPEEIKGPGKPDKGTGRRSETGRNTGRAGKNSPESPWKVLLFRERDGRRGDSGPAAARPEPFFRWSLPWFSAEFGA